MSDLEHFTREAQDQVNAALATAENARDALVAANNELREANARAAALVAENARLRAIITDLRARAKVERQSIDARGNSVDTCTAAPDYAPGKAC